jgi:hypothetical protein
LDDPARGISIEARERTAQDFDPLGGGKVEGGGLPLSIGHRRGDAIGDEAHAAHAESGATAEAARGHLQVLRVVLAVLHDDAGHAIDRLGKIHLGFVFADRARVDHVDRRRNAQRVLREARRGDDDIGTDVRHRLRPGDGPCDARQKRDGRGSRPAVRGTIHATRAWG